MPASDWQSTEIAGGKVGRSYRSPFKGLSYKTLRFQGECTEILSCPASIDRQSCFDQPCSDRVTDQSGGRIHVELAHRGCPVCLGRLDAEVQNGADALVAIALRHQLDDELFPWREPVAPVSLDAGSAIQVIRAAVGTERLVHEERLDGRKQRL